MYKKGWCRQYPLSWTIPSPRECCIDSANWREQSSIAPNSKFQLLFSAAVDDTIFHPTHQNQALGTTVKFFSSTNHPMRTAAQPCWLHLPQSTPAPPLLFTSTTPWLTQMTEIDSSLFFFGLFSAHLQLCISPIRWLEWPFSNVNLKSSTPLNSRP